MEFEPKIKHLRMGGMGIFLWWIMVAWEEEARAYWLKELKKTLTMIRKKRVDRINAFMWVCDANPKKTSGSNAHYNNKGPYEFVKDTARWKIDFTKWNKKWIKLARMFVQANYDVCPEDPVDIQFILQMPKYTKYAYANNVNNVGGFYTKNALKYKRNFARWVLRMLKSIHGKDYKSFLIFENEPECRNNHMMGHAVADSHRDVYSAVKADVPLRNIVVDSGECEFAFAPFVQRQRCPKYGSQGCTRYFGSDSNLDSHGKRQAEPTQHGSVLVENMKDGRLATVIGSALIYAEWHEDGGCSKKFLDIARGTKLRNKHGIVTHAWGDKKQVRQKCEYIWYASKRGDIDSYIAICVPETLIMNAHGILIEDFRVIMIDWTRFNQAAFAHMKVYNHE